MIADGIPSQNIVLAGSVANIFEFFLFSTRDIYILLILANNRWNSYYNSFLILADKQSL